MIKAVIFDVDGVLIDSLKANTHFFRALMAKFGYLNVVIEEEYEKIFHVPMKGLIKLWSKSESEEEIEKIWRAGRDREVSYNNDLLNIPEKLKETIENLSKDYILGIVTSRVKNGVYGVPQIVEIIKYFKTVVTFEDTEVHKPDPTPLLLAAERLNIPAEECVYVGDTESDVTAAKAAGMKIIYYSKKVSPEADAITAVFSELPELVKKL